MFQCDADHVSSNVKPDESGRIVQNVSVTRLHEMEAAPETDQGIAVSHILNTESSDLGDSSNPLNSNSSNPEVISLNSREENIKFISYNVDGLSQNKFATICATLDGSYDVICFLETFADRSDQYKLEGYDCFASLRKRGVGARRNSGGLLVLIKKSISACFKQLHSSLKDILWFRVSGLLLGDDVILGIGYCSPINSRAIENNSFFFALEENLYYHLNMYPNDKIIIVGDFNSRTGNLQDCITSDSEDSTTLLCEAGAEFFQQNANIPARVNSDKEINAYGRVLLSLCNEFGLCLCNGRSGNDKNLGSYTCITHNGASVVDYVLVSHEILSEVQDFEVLNLSDFSVHFPLIFTLRSLHTPVNEQHQVSSIFSDQTNAQNNVNLKQRIKYVWKEECGESFVAKLENDAPALQGLQIANMDDVNTALVSFYDTLDNCARDMKHTQKPYNSTYPKAPSTVDSFFDDECRKAKTKLNKARSELNEVLRQNHLVGGLDSLVDSQIEEFKVVKSSYKSLVKEKKDAYLKEKESLAKSLSADNLKF